jgi:hypothetical protein
MLRCWALYRLEDDRFEQVAVMFSKRNCDVLALRLAAEGGPVHTAVEKILPVDQAWQQVGYWPPTRGH